MPKAHTHCGGLHEIISLAPQWAPTAAVSRGELPAGMAGEVEDFLCLCPEGLFSRHAQDARHRARAARNSRRKA